MSGPKEVSVIVRAKDLTLDGLTRARGAIQSWGKSVEGQLTSFFGAKAIVDSLGNAIGSFFRRSKEEVEGAERASTQLGTTLANIGVDMGKVRPDIDAAIASLQKVANVDDDDAIDGLNTLVRMTGNYRQSVKDLNLVADVAAAKQISFGEAAELVGKVASGTGSRALRDFGISTKDTALAMDELRAKVKGAAETEMNTLEGSLKAADLAYGDLAQSVGEVIEQSPGFQKFARTVVDGLRNMASWVTQHKTMLQGWLAILLAGVTETWNLLNELVRAVVNIGVAAFAAGKAISTMFDFSAEGRAANADANILLRTALGEVKDALNYDLVAAWKRVSEAGDQATTAQVKGLKLTEEQLRKNKKAHDELAAADAAAKAAAEKGQSAGNLRGAIEKRDKENAKFDEGAEQITDRGRLIGAAQNKADLEAMLKQSGAGVTADLAGLKADAAGAKVFGAKNTDFAGPGPDLGFGQRLGLAIGDGTKDVDRAQAKMESLGKVIADIASGPILAFGDAMQNAFDAAISGSMTLGKAFLQSIGGAVRNVASLKGKLFAGEALAALGEGFLGNAGAFVAAAKYGLAAATMFALAGAAGSIGQGGGGGGGGSTPAAASASSQRSLQDVGQGNLTVILKGKKAVIDKDDPDEQDGFIAMMKKVAGNRQIDFVVDPNG